MTRAVRQQRTSGIAAKMTRIAIYFHEDFYRAAANSTTQPSRLRARSGLRSGTTARPGRCSPTRPGGQSGATADPENDGIVSAFEFLLGLSPSVAPQRAPHRANPHRCATRPRRIEELSLLPNPRPQTTPRHHPHPRNRESARSKSNMNPLRRLKCRALSSARAAWMRPRWKASRNEIKRKSNASNPARESDYPTENFLVPQRPTPPNT